jgi:hypothetical protein
LELTVGRKFRLIYDVRMGPTPPLITDDEPLFGPASWTIAIVFGALWTVGGPLLLLDDHDDRWLVGVTAASAALITALAIVAVRKRSTALAPALVGIPLVPAVAAICAAPRDVRELLETVLDPATGVCPVSALYGSSANIPIAFGFFASALLSILSAFALFGVLALAPASRAKIAGAGYTVATVLAAIALAGLELRSGIAPVPLVASVGALGFAVAWPFVVRERDAKTAEALVAISVLVIVSIALCDWSSVRIAESQVLKRLAFDDRDGALAAAGQLHGTGRQALGALLALLVVAPALAFARPRSSRPVGVMAMTGLFAVGGLFGFARWQAQSLEPLVVIAKRRASELPAEPVQVDRRLALPTHRWDVDIAVDEGGRAHRFRASPARVIAPDRRAPFASVLEASAQTPVVELAGIAVTGPLPPTLSELFFVYGETNRLLGYEVELAARIDDRADLPNPFGGGGFLTSNKIFVLGRTPLEATLLCNNDRLVTVEKISFADPNAASGAFGHFAARCKPGQRIIVAPTADARATDVFGMLAALPQGSIDKQPRIVLTSDRAAVQGWLERWPASVDLEAQGRKQQAEARRIRQGVTEIHGPLPAEVVHHVVREQMKGFQRCYDEALARVPTLAGRWVVRFTIAADGRVEAPKVDPDSLPDATTGACLLEIFGAITFPRPEGGGRVSVVYPLLFSPS